MLQLSSSIYRNSVYQTCESLQKESSHHDRESAYQVAQLGPNDESVQSSGRRLSDPLPHMYLDDDFSSRSLTEFLTEDLETEEDHTIPADKASTKKSPWVVPFRPGEQKSLPGLAVKRPVTKVSATAQQSSNSEAASLSEPKKKRSACVPAKRSVKRGNSVHEAEACNSGPSDVPFERYRQAPTFIDGARAFPEAFVARMPHKLCRLLEFSDGDASQHWEVANNVAYTEDIVSYSEFQLRDVWLSKPPIAALPCGYSSAVKFTQPREHTGD